MTDAHEQLGSAFRAVNIAMRRMRGRQTHQHNGLSYAQYGLLFALDGSGALSARSLGEAASLSPASVTQMLEGLEAGGLVARTRSAEDRRIVLTELTESGRSAVAEMRARMEPAWRAALVDFSDDQLRTAAAVLEALAAHFTRMADVPSDAVGAGVDQLA